MVTGVWVAVWATLLTVAIAAPSAWLGLASVLVMVAGAAAPPPECTGSRAGTETGTAP